MLVSIILPVHNEAKRIENTIQRIEQVMKGKQFEIITSEDGSTDGSDRIISKVVKRNKKIVSLHSDKKLGKGNALKRGFLRARGDIICFMDMDLSTDINHLPELIKQTKKYDIVIGSRYIRGSMTSRVFKRDLLSQGYNLLVRFLFNSKVHDHQCGFKAFRRKVILDLIRNSQADKWFIDTELIVLAQEKGYTIKEIPIKWKEDLEATKIKIVRDTMAFLADLIELRLRLWFK